MQVPPSTIHVRKYRHTNGNPPRRYPVEDYERRFEKYRAMGATEDQAHILAEEFSALDEDHSKQGRGT